MLRPSAELSYILGVIYGDGWVVVCKKSGNYRVGLHTVSLEFAQEFQKALETINLHTNLYPMRNKGFGTKQLYRVQAASRRFVDWWRNLSISEIEQLVTDNPTHFLRGFFDSEGSFSTSGQASLSNTNLDRLALVQRIGTKLQFSMHLHKYMHAAQPTYGLKERLEYRLNLHGSKSEQDRFTNLCSTFKTRGMYATRKRKDRCSDA